MQRSTYRLPLDSTRTACQEVLERLHKSLRITEERLAVTRRVLEESCAALRTGDTIATPPKISD